MRVIQECGDEAARLRLLEGHRELASAAGVERLRATAFNLAASDPKLALAVAELAHAAARELDDDARAIADQARARALFVCARYRESAQLLGALIEHYERRQQHREAATAHLGLISTFMYLSGPEQALAAAARARKAAQASNDRVAEAKVDINLGNALHRFDRLTEALECFRRARPVFARRGDRGDVAVIDLNAANVHSLLGHQNLVDRLLTRARATFVDLGQAPRVVLVDYNRACDDLTNGRFDHAWRGLEAVRGSYRALEDPFGVALAELDLAELAQQLGASDWALCFARSSREGFEALGIQLEAARARCVEASVLASRGALAKACQTLAIAETELDRNGQSVRAALARVDRAALLVDHDPDTAKALAKAARTTLEHDGFHARAIRATLVEGLASADPDRARPLLQSARRRAARRAAYDVIWQAERALARIELRAGRRRPASRHLERAVAAVDRFRADIRRVDLTAWVIAERHSVYADAIRAQLGPGATDRVVGRPAARAFEFAERARARAMGDAVAVSGTTIRPSRGSTRAEKARISSLRRTIDQSLRRLFHRHRNTVADDGILSELARAEAALSDALAPLEVVGGAAAVPDARALQARLSTTETLVEFQTLDGELWAFIMSRQRIIARRLRCPLATASQLIGDFDYQLAKVSFGEGYGRRHRSTLQRAADAVLAELGRRLLGPLVDELATTRLIVVPTGALHGVPFAALRLQGQHVLDRFALSVAPSALSYCHLQRRPGRGRPLVVGVGGRATPEVAREAREVARVLGDCDLLIGADASRATLLTRVAGRAVLHFASHGLFRPKHPLLSGLQLDDGWLTIHDILGLRLSADIVTIAACDSGRADAGAGDQLVGLARAFLQAGAHTVLGGQWNLDDRSARRVMTSFFRAYRTGTDKAAAVRTAMQHERARSPHPYFWAPYILVGAR